MGYLKYYFGSGEIRTRVSEETGALNQRLRPLGHATLLFPLNKFTQFEDIARTKRNTANLDDILNEKVYKVIAIKEVLQMAHKFKDVHHQSI